MQSVEAGRPSQSTWSDTGTDTGTHSKSCKCKLQGWNLVCRAPGTFNHTIIDKYIKWATTSKEGN